MSDNEQVNAIEALANRMAEDQQQRDKADQAAAEARQLAQAEQGRAVAHAYDAEHTGNEMLALLTAAQTSNQERRRRLTGEPNSVTAAPVVGPPIDPSPVLLTQIASRPAEPVVSAPPPVAPEVQPPPATPAPPAQPAPAAYYTPQPPPPPVYPVAMVPAPAVVGQNQSSSRKAAWTIIIVGGIIAALLVIVLAVFLIMKKTNNSHNGYNSRTSAPVSKSVPNKNGGVLPDKVMLASYNQFGNGGQ